MDQAAQASKPAAEHAPKGAPKAALLALLPQVAVVFFGMAAVGVPLPVLPVLVHDTLGYGAVMVGWVIGCQSLATVLTRGIAGPLCDRHGPRFVMLTGLPCAAFAGLLYLLAAVLPVPGILRLAVLLLGRLLLGCAESLFLTGTLTWGIGRMGPGATGKVMSWQGIAMYAALALGGPAGIAIERYLGFAAVAVVTILCPLIGLGVAWSLPGVARTTAGKARTGFLSVIGLVWQPGAVLALGTVAVAAISAFVALDFAARGWAQAGLAFSGFGGGYILLRLIGGHLPDRIGGRRVGIISLLGLTLGQLLIFLAPIQAVALLGALVSGIGFSLVFPAMGVEAMRRTTPEVRGMAVAAYVAFFDIAFGVAGPVCGLIVAGFGYAAVFLFGALAAIAGAALLLRQ
jgi:MFS family permease